MITQFISSEWTDCIDAYAQAYFNVQATVVLFLRATGNCIAFNEGNSNKNVHPRNGLGWQQGLDKEERSRVLDWLLGDDYGPIVFKSTPDCGYPVEVSMVRRNFGQWCLCIIETQSLAPDHPPHSLSLEIVVGV